MIVTDADTYRDHLADLRNAGVVNDENPLILGVEAKVDAGAELTSTEYGILWNAITEDALDVIRLHPALL
jgi:hypothetical protein